jgi:hypothetical protein
MSAPAVQSRLVSAVLDGRAPAECLTPADRRTALLRLVQAGWDPARIALHVRATTYTVCRWLDLYELRPPHRTEGGQAA